jgi:hypothetical protein
MVSIFSCVFDIWTSSCDKALLSTFANFFTVSLIWGSFVFWAPWIFFQSLVWCIAGNNHSHSVSSLFNLETISFIVQKLFKLHVVPFVHSSSHLLGNSLLMPVASSVFPALSCTSFKVSDHIVRSLIHSELILGEGERHGSSFSFLHWTLNSGFIFPRQALYHLKPAPPNFLLLVLFFR